MDSVYESLPTLSYLNTKIILFHEEMNTKIRIVMLQWTNGKWVIYSFLKHLILMLLRDGVNLHSCMFQFTNECYTSLKFQMLPRPYLTI